MDEESAGKFDRETKLRAELEDARQEWVAARRRFQQVLDEVSAGIPNPDEASDQTCRP